ncbi:eukaryotic translation initiation factor 3 [Capsaspora owczarzaki ATCC 30864]|uniref:Eukaryotic translation initiation factor 3 subunit L n=1 Tax=Capsaspora owczarzaki (strain ATCC 30864) TaxID=595528 RepID=A0A0D2WVP7_CAPO3|nr:eukaryotic translation initiation factor 3 [Capsaspora owczarzaki ATCC 30864]KJE96343.1 eukaryotic translation initiation factor 3 [Capsaspora owczarzaki ATCC 30864]|eukprot:XP_004344304.2 eukaryotic translation initiation factor 3 [Capsaspora owczarzaki ATCC 30864]
MFSDSIEIETEAMGTYVPSSANNRSGRRGNNDGNYAAFQQGDFPMSSGAGLFGSAEAAGAIPIGAATSAGLFGTPGANVAAAAAAATAGAGAGAGASSAAAAAAATSTTNGIPDIVAKFLIFFQRTLAENKNVNEITSVYDGGFAQTTERYYKNAPWPSADLIAPLVDNDTFFLILYKELYYRHIYARLTPTLEQRLESYENYCDLFDFILNRDQPVDIELPNQWLWDMIDEFIYQFQSFCQLRARADTKTPEELAFFEANPQVWDVHSVLIILHSLAEKSNINQQLELQRVGGPNAEGLAAVAGEFGSRGLYRQLGFFALIGLCRLHCQLGDYYQALKVLDSLDFGRRGMHFKVPACQITAYYYVGFAYFMLRRYQDVVRTLSSILLLMLRTRLGNFGPSHQVDMSSKKNEQMYALLGMAVAFNPQRLDETLQATLREKLGEKYQKLQKGDEATFEELFKAACPKFIAPVVSDTPSNPLALQQRLFLAEMKQQILLPAIRSYLKLYTTMPIAKLASFLDVDTDTCRTQLLSYKHKMRSVVWSQGPPLSGEFHSTSDIDFYLNKDMIHIADTKVARRYGSVFIKLISNSRTPNDKLASA